MRRLLQAVSWAALAATLVPPVLYLAGQTSLDAVKSWMLGATIAWFVVTPMWMDRE